VVRSARPGGSDGDQLGWFEVDGTKVRIAGVRDA
jgi:hypothetical protein